MKRIISLMLAIVMLLSASVPVMADNENNVQPYSEYGENMLDYLKTDNHKLLVLRENYGYMQFVEEFKTDVLSLYLMEMTDKLIETGTEPDEKKYIEVLINIIGTYELDNAADISEQNKMDNLKSFKDYAMDLVEIGENAVGVMVAGNPAASAFEVGISTAISGISTLAENTDNWIEALSDLETIVQNYSKWDEFLKLIEEKADGNLKKAAITLRSGMKSAFKIKLDTYADISNENFQNYGEYIFTDVFWLAIKATNEYETDEALRFFVDGADTFVSTVMYLKSSWELGTAIGKLVGNVTVGGEDLINRVLELMALYDISSILQMEVIELGNEFLGNIGTEEENDIVDRYMALAQYLIGCRIRGEYCLYSIVANDAGLLSWFNKESAEDAKAWYNDKARKILDIQSSLLEISQHLAEESNLKEERYKAYAEKIQYYESKYGVAQIDKVSEWMSYMTGLCFAKLVDFSQSGEEELLLAYQMNSNTEYGIVREYKFEIWGFVNNEIVMLDSGELFGTDAGVKHIYLAEHDEKIYLVTGGADSFGYYYYHGYLDGKFGVVREAIWEEGENGEQVCSINGIPVSYDVFEQEEQLWFGNVSEYNLSYDCDKVLGQIAETKKQLGMENDTQNIKNISAKIENTFPNDVPYISKLTVSLSNGTTIEKVYDETLKNNSSGWYANMELADLTGDGQDEVVVSLDWIGSTFGATDIYVYVIKESDLVPILELDSDNIRNLSSQFEACVGVGIEDNYLNVSGIVNEDIVNIKLKYSENEWIAFE